MTMQGPPPGWHPDPNGQGGSLRWWDGAGWTDHTHPGAPPAFGPSPLPTGAGAGAGFGSAPAPGYGPGYGPGPGAPGYGAPQPQAYGQGPPPGFAPPGVPTVPAFGRTPVKRSFAQRNSLSLSALGVVAVYIALAVVTHFVLIGVVPVLLAVRAVQRRETLAPLAIVAAAAAVVVAFTVLSHH